MKKLISIMMAVVIMMSPVGTQAINFVTPDQYKTTSVTTVSAKMRGGGYRSSNRSYNTNSNRVKSNTNRTNTNRAATNKAVTANKAQAKSRFGGFLGGMMLGGLAGMLFGGMLANMGGFGNILGMIINVLAIIIIIRLVFMIISRIRQNKKAQATAGGYSDSRQMDRDQDVQTNYQNAMGGGAATAEAETGIVLDEDNISNAVIDFFSYEKQINMYKMQVSLTYDERQGFGADVLNKSGSVIQSLDHFSLVQAIRYWAEKETDLNPNMGIKLNFSEDKGITATLS